MLGPNDIHDLRQSATAANALVRRLQHIYNTSPKMGSEDQKALLKAAGRIEGGAEAMKEAADLLANLANRNVI